ncbi:MAG: hypothetical protein AB8B73_01640 [Ekhidna sp.]
MKLSIGTLLVVATVALVTLTSMKMETKKKETGAYLEITLNVKEENRMSAGGIYVKYKEPFLKQITGATSKELLMRDEDVQVLHGFQTKEEALAYLTTELFENDVVRELKPYLESNPEIRIYSVFQN